MVTASLLTFYTSYFIFIYIKVSTKIYFSFGKLFFFKCISINSRIKVIHIKCFQMQIGVPYLKERYFLGLSLNVSYIITYPYILKSKHPKNETFEKVSL